MLIEAAYAVEKVQGETRRFLGFLLYSFVACFFVSSFRSSFCSLPCISCFSCVFLPVILSEPSLVVSFVIVGRGLVPSCFSPVCQSFLSSTVESLGILLCFLFCFFPCFHVHPFLSFFRELLRYLCVSLAFRFPSLRIQSSPARKITNMSKTCQDKTQQHRH